MQLIHLEGYCLYRPAFTRELLAQARAQGATTSIDLASFEVRSAHVGTCC